MPSRSYNDYELRRKMALKRKGVTQSDLAKEWNTSQPFVSRLLSGDSRSRQHEEALAKRLDMDISDLFPLRAQRERVAGSMEIQQDEQ